MVDGFGNPGTGTKTTIEVPVELFENFGPAFFHETAIDGKEEESGYSFEWNRGVAMPGLALLVRNPDGKVVQSAYFDESELVKTVAAMLIKRDMNNRTEENP